MKNDCYTLSLKVVRSLLNLLQPYYKSINFENMRLVLIKSENNIIGNVKKKDKRTKGQKDKQRSTKHYIEN